MTIFAISQLLVIGSTKFLCLPPIILHCGGLTQKCLRSDHHLLRYCKYKILNSCVISWTPCELLASYQHVFKSANKKEKFRIHNFETTLVAYAVIILVFFYRNPVMPRTLSCYYVEKIGEFLGRNYCLQTFSSWSWRWIHEGWSVH